MTHLNKAQKLVKIVELMTRRGGIRATEIMDRFELDARSLRRYLADLKELDLPILDEGHAEDRTIQLDPEYRRSGVQLTLPEVLSLHFGRKLFTFLDNTQFAQDLDDAIERLAPAISRSTADLTRDLDRKFMAVPEPTKDYTDAGEAIDDIITALIYDNPLRAEYRRPEGASKQYTLEPLTLATYRQGLYLFARDRDDGRIKTFAVERFQRISRLRMEKFSAPTDYSPEAHVADAFGIISVVPADIVARFAPHVAAYIRERRWHPSQRIDELADGGVRLHMRVGASQELVTWLLGFGPDVVVEGPERLIERIQEAHTEALERYT